MKAYYTVVIKNKKGKVVRRFRRLSRSYLRQWNDIVYCQSQQNANTPITDTGGVSRDVDTNAQSMGMPATAGTTSRGIVIGTGNTAVDIEDYSLEAIIDEGAGAGQMNYALQTVVTEPTVSGNDCYFEIQRVMTNNSGSTITVNECGIGFKAWDGTALRFFLAIRDVFSSGVDVVDGASITITYTIKVTV